MARIKLNYKFAVLIYSIILVGFLLWLLMMSLGTSENAEFSVLLIIIILIILLTIASISVFPILIVKFPSQKFILVLINIIMIITTLAIFLFFIIPLDFSVFLIITSISYVISGIAILIKTKEKVKTTANNVSYEKQ